MNVNLDGAFSDCEKIEISRRSDEAKAIISASVRHFIKREEVRASLASRVNSIDNLLYLMSLFVGIALDQFLRELSPGVQLNFGTFICLIVFLVYFINKFNSYKLHHQFDAVNEKLYELEMKWIAATGATTFWDIYNFIKDFDFNEDDEKFRLWQNKQNYLIIASVCGWERANKITAREQEVLSEELNLE